jgi:hypothetical protein
MAAMSPDVLSRAAFSLTPPMAARVIPARMAMTAMTTRSSIKVNAALRWRTDSGGRRTEGGEEFSVFSGSVFRAGEAAVRQKIGDRRSGIGNAEWEWRNGGGGADGDVGAPRGPAETMCLSVSISG